jgi:transposase-like protein
MKKKLSLIPLIAAPLLTLVGCTSSHTHVLNLIEEVSANCEVEGLLAHYECESCDKLFNLNKEVVKYEDLIIAKHHTLIFNEGMMPECLTDGYYAHYECTHCHKLFKDEDATNETTLEEIALTAVGSHTLTFSPYKAPTCVLNGYNEYYKCDACEKVFTDETATNETTLEDLVISPTGHNISYVAYKEMTCLEDGNIEHYYCNKCDKHYKDADGVVEIFNNAWLIEANHDLTYIEAKDASYYEDGYTISHYHCNKCSSNYLDSAASDIISEEVLIHKYQKAFDFEDEIHPYIKEITGAKVSLTNEESSKGNKSLKVELGESGTFKLALDLNYLKQIFKLSEVTSINFDIKGKFAAKDFYYESKTNVWGVERYEKTSDYVGVATYWKSVSFTKEMLTDLGNSNVVIRIDNSVNNVIYIDNIRASKKSADISFERNSISSPDVDNNYVVYNTTKDINTPEAMVNGANLNVEFSNDRVSDGQTSIRVRSNSATFLSLYIPYSLYQEAEGSGICYDIFIATSDVMHVYDNDNIQPRPYINNENQGVWETFYVPYNAIIHFNNTWAKILGNRVNNNFDFYIDNIRVAKNYNVDFENEQLLEENNHSAMISFDSRNTYEISSDISYSGAYSLKIDPLEAWCKAFMINNVIYNNIPSTGGISFYVYSNYQFNLGPTDNYHYWNPVKEWKEIRIAKQDIRAVDYDHYVFLISADVIVYVDNIQVVDVI